MPSGLVATIKVPTTLTEATGIVLSEITKQPTAIWQSPVDMQPTALGNMGSIAKCLLISQQHDAASEHYPEYIEHTIKWCNMMYYYTVHVMHTLRY